MSSLDWQLMDTAPKDGTPILACYGGYDTSAFPLLCEAPQTVSWRTNYQFGVKQRAAWRDALRGYLVRGLTHWAPMPEGPRCA